MSNKEILEEAIQDAIDGGWEPFAGTAMDVNGVMGWFELDEAASSLNYENYKLFIFNHDFAKALWGEYGYVPEARYYFRYKENSGVEKTRVHTLQSSVSPWQYHLQQMVISEDPIKYLGENI